MLFRALTPESTDDETLSSRSSAGAEDTNDDEYKVESSSDEDEGDVKSFPDKRFKCQCCGQRYLTVTKLRSHMESAHGCVKKSKLKG